MKVYLIKDETGKIWREYCKTDKRFLIQQFARDFLSILDRMEDIDCQQFWRFFEKNGWEIVEFEVETQHTIGNYK
jgi:hypothetical protein